MAFSCCKDNKSVQQTEEKDSIAVTIADSALYGIVGEGTTMHMLEIVTDEGKTLQLEMDTDTLSDIQGGVFAGDRITVLVTKGENQNAVTKLVNLTTLLGKWTSLDSNFEIKDDGTIESSVKSESRPYTHWQMVNCNLILNTDTFSVLQLASDSLALENNVGVFVYKRLGREK